MKKYALLSATLWLAASLIVFITPYCATAQMAPGPHEILPYEDGFIVEAFKDLQTNSAGLIEDWTGFSGTAWVSPNAYNDHLGTDVSVQTGTRLYATAS